MRVLIIEDHEELARLVQARLASARLLADWFPTAEQGRLAIEAGSYSAIVLDLGLPDSDGLTLLRWLRKRNDPVPVLLLTARSSIADRITGLTAGADDYLIKPFAAEELIARIEALLRRSGAAHQQTHECGRIVWERQARTATVEGKVLLLTPREMQLLELLLIDAGRVVRKARIEASFFGMDEEFSSNAVEVSIHRLRRRLETENAGVEIVTMRGIGYLLRATA